MKLRPDTYYEKGRLYAVLSPLSSECYVHMQMYAYSSGHQQLFLLKLPLSLALFCPPAPSVMEIKSDAVQMCPRYPDPVPLDHPIPILKDALEKVCCSGADEGCHTTERLHISFSDLVFSHCVDHV